MQKQTGCCAFSNACIHPGPRQRLQGTNRQFCPVHYQAIGLQTSAGSGTEFSQVQFHPPRQARRRSRWLSLAGVSGVL